MIKISASNWPPKKAAPTKAPVKKATAGTAMSAIGKKGLTARKKNLTTYVGKGALSKAPAKGFKAPAKKVAARSASTGQFVSIVAERKPNAATRAALAEVTQMVAAFKKRHGVS